MTNKNRIFARISVAVMAIAMIVPLVASAATVTSANLALGDPRPSQTTSYTFSGSGFTTGTQIRCVQLRFNTAADGSGSVPSGMTTTGSTLTSSTLVSGFTVDNTSNGSLRATSATLTNPAGSGNVIWGGVVSGNTANTTYYGLLTTHALQDCTGAAVDSTTMAYVYKDGALVSLIVDPTLTFNVSGVASGQTVNSATTNITSTGTAIDFARIANVATKGISAHDLQVITNAGGNTVYLRQTGTGLYNGAYNITPWTGTNAAPTTFPAAGTEAWGYTTQDANLAGTGGTTRFTSASNWAGMPTTNELVMDSATSGSQTIRVGQQLGIGSSTPAGNYNTTLVYTASGTY